MSSAHGSPAFPSPARESRSTSNLPSRIASVDAKERAIRELYDARARRDWGAVGALLGDEVGWHEPGEEDHSGGFRGRDEVARRSG